jgi:hypothetical protein
LFYYRQHFYGRGDASEAEDREQNTEGWPGLRGYEASPLTSHFCANNHRTVLRHRSQ